MGWSMGGCTSTSMRAFCMAASCCTWRMICILLSSAIAWDVLGYEGWRCSLRSWQLGGGMALALSKKLATSMKLRRARARARSVVRRQDPCQLRRVERPLITSIPSWRWNWTTTCLFRPLRASPTPGSLLFASSLPAASCAPRPIAGSDRTFFARARRVVRKGIVPTGA